MGVLNLVHDVESVLNLVLNLVDSIPSFDSFHVPITESGKFWNTSTRFGDNIL